MRNKTYADKDVTGIDAHLAQVVKVVLAVDPSVRQALVEAIRLVLNILHVGSVTVVEHSLEQLYKHTHTHTLMCHSGKIR